MTKAKQDRTPKQRTKPAKTPTRDKTPTETPAPKVSALTAAAQVLREAGEPLRVRVVFERMVERHLWQSAGRTPAATIAAGMLREIAVKGAASRFAKAGKGLFALAPGQ